MQWKFCVLGTKAGGAPLADKHCSATALVLPSETLLFDCGEHTQVQLLRAGIARRSIRRICISHLHGDHVLGLLGLLSTMSGDQRSEPLYIYAPNNAERSLETFIRYGLALMDMNLSYELVFHTLEPGWHGELVRTEEYRLSASMLEHRIPSFGFRVDRVAQTNIDLVKAAAKGLMPGALMGILKREGSVQLPNGEKIMLSEVATHRHQPLSFVYCGDTCICNATVELARNATVLIHEATFSDEMLGKAEDRFHSTASQAAKQAKAAHAKRLVLTHHSVRYKTLSALLEQAQAIFPQTTLAKELRWETLEQP
jgi:ribonuclease Z